MNCNLPTLISPLASVVNTVASASVFTQEIAPVVSSFFRYCPSSSVLFAFLTTNFASARTDLSAESVLTNFLSPVYTLGLSDGFSLSSVVLPLLNLRVYSLGFPVSTFALLFNLVSNLTEIFGFVILPVSYTHLTLPTTPYV